MENKKKNQIQIKVKVKRKISSFAFYLLRKTLGYGKILKRIVFYSLLVLEPFRPEGGKK